MTLRVVEEHIVLRGDRLYGALNDFLVISAAMTYATATVQGDLRPIVPGETAGLQAIHGPFWVRVPVYGPIQAAVTDRKPDFIHYFYAEDDSLPWEPAITNYSGLATIMASFAAATFTNFYEAHAELISETVGNDKSQWPELLRFATIVRNSLSHGWQINIRNSRSLPASWRGLTLGPDDNGTKTVNSIIGVGDILVLLKDTCDALDALGIPQPQGAR